MQDDVSLFSPCTFSLYDAIHFLFDFLFFFLIRPASCFLAALLVGFR